MADDTRSIYDLIRSAYAAVKNNKLPEVVSSFKTDLDRLYLLLAAEGAPGAPVTMRRHPISVLYAAHICTLTGSEVAARTDDAYQWCDEVLGREHLYLPLIAPPTDTN